MAVETEYYKPEELATSTLQLDFHHLERCPSGDWNLIIRAHGVIELPDGRSIDVDREINLARLRQKGRKPRTDKYFRRKNADNV